MDFILADADERWIREMNVKAFTELRNAPDGRVFASTVNTVLERDSQSVRWKNSGCMVLEKINKPKDDAIVKSAKELQQEEEQRWDDTFKRLIPSSEFPNEPGPEPYGSRDLQLVWEGGINSLEGLERTGEVGDLSWLAKQIKFEEFNKQKARKMKGLPPRVVQAPQPSRPNTPVPAASQDTQEGTPGPTDGQAASPAKVDGKLAPPAAPRFPSFSVQITPREKDPELEAFDLVRDHVFIFMIHRPSLF